MTKIESVVSNKRTEFSLGINMEDLLIMFIGFFISRVNILDKLSPFSIAFLGSYLLVKGKNLYLLISVLLGTFSLRGFKGVEYYMTIIIVYEVLSRIREGKSYTLIKSSSIPALIFIAIKSIFIILIGEYYIYDMVLILIEGIMIFTMTYIFSFSLPIEEVNHQSINNEKLICSFVTLALILSGFNNIEFLGITLRNIISVVMVMYLSYKQGVLMGVNGGIILGLVSYMPSAEMPFVISILAVGGLLAGLFKELGKIGTILGFVLGNGIISFYINNLGTSLISTRELILSSIIFLIMAQYIDIDIKEIFVGESYTKEESKNRKDELVIKNLKNMVNLFNNLSKIFKETTYEDDIYSTGEIYIMIDDICNKSCIKCPKYKKCWEEDYYNTYQKIFNIIGAVESEAVDIKKYAVYMEESCENGEHLLKNIKQYYEKLKEEHIWNQKLMDQRRLLAEQLENVGYIVEQMSQDIYKIPVFNEELEDLIIKELKNERVSLSDLTVVESDKDDLEVLVGLENNEICPQNVREIKNIVSKNLGFPLATDFSIGHTREDAKVLTLTKSSRFDFITNVSTESNSEDRISGDSYTYGEVDTTGFVAISDGMGIGKKANIESRTAIELFEKLMEINMDKNIIIKTINSVLRARTDEEIFATLDLGFIDLYTGKLQMLKTGAPATFIKRKDQVNIVNSRSLPIGILKDVEFDIYEEDLEDGDIIIMMSDGILDSNRDVHSQESWMKDIIMNIDSQNPNSIAELILKEAKSISENHITDDMTVMATKIWRNI
ncbi:MAG TPA: stage II sporulation protein E [Tissierellaceae bacterium]|nr:stage II sporulation protein E [Tissierellaceae bacterium]